MKRREVRVSPKRRETRVLKREARVSYAENEPHVSNPKSKPCVLELRRKNREPCVSISKCETHEVRISEALPNRRAVRIPSQGHETRVFVPRREVRVSPKRRETRVLKHEVRVSSAENEPRVFNSKSELRISETCVSKLWCKTHVYFSTIEVRAEMGSPHPQKFEVGLFGPPPTDLRDYLTKKRNVHQITPQCCCEWLMTAVISECHCSSTCKQTVSIQPVIINASLPLNQKASLLHEENHL